MGPGHASLEMLYLQRADFKSTNCSRSELQPSLCIDPVLHTERVEQAPQSAQWGRRAQASEQLL